MMKNEDLLFLLAKRRKIKKGREEEKNMGERENNYFNKIIIINLAYSGY